jgi:thiosulfate reductase cytochrome b subunit
LDISGLNIAAVLHTDGAFMVVAFVIIHVYMTTTGDTVSSNVKAMISGFEKEPQNNNETSSISE